MAKERKKNTVSEDTYEIEKEETLVKEQQDTPKEEKNSTKKEKKHKAKRERKQRNENSILHQIMPAVMLALCAFVGICIYTGLSVGVIGSWISFLLFGLFGFTAYFVPFLFLLLAVFWQKDVRESTLGRKAIFGTVVLLLVSVLFYTFGVVEEKKYAFSEFWQMGLNKQGGGVLGNTVGVALNFCVAKPGTIIISVLALLLFAVLFFNFRPKYVAEAVRRSMQKMKEKREEAKAQAQATREKAEERKRERRENAEEDFYAKKAVVTTAVVPHEATPKQKPRDSFLVNHDGETTPKPVTRSFFDAAAEDENWTTRENVAVAPVAPATFEDDFFNDSPVSPDLLLGEEIEVPIISQQGVTGSTPPSVSSDIVKDKDKITVVSDKPIPERPLSSVRDVRSFADTEDESSVSDSEDALYVSAEDEMNETENDFGAEEQEQEDKLIINKAHTIEHLGADTFIDETDELYKSRNPDTFFYSFPPLSLLHEDDATNQEDSDQEITEKASRLKKTLESYGVQAEIKCISRGPRLTRYELVPREGVRIRAVENLVDEIAMNLEAVSVRIEAPIPGKAAIGVEVPNVKYSTVRLRGLLDTDTFRDAPGKTTVCLGVDVVGVPVFADLDKMPHLLVAGATGMGKSVCINSILISLLYKARPDEVKLILIDPKKVEFKSYYNIPHLLVPVVTEPQKAAGALSWAVNEMERRYDIIERTGVRNIKAYNATLADHPEREKIPQIVIVIDELHDLMLQARDAVEDSIARIAAKARAAGILLIIGTQRPSVNVITGVIKANIPSRIAFHVASQVDSRTILDAVGAEKLLNDGDMLFLSPGMKMMTPKRVQGAFLDDDEVTRVAEYLRKNSSDVRYDESIMADMDRESEKYNKDKKPVDNDIPMTDGESSEDDLFYRAIEVALESGKVSTSLLQRKLSLGFGKAARMIDRMQEMGVVSAPNGQKPRDVLISLDEYRAMRLKNDE